VRDRARGRSSSLTPRQGWAEHQLVDTRVIERCAFCDFTITVPVEEAWEAFREHECSRPRPAPSGRRAGFHIGGPPSWSTSPADRKECAGISVFRSERANRRGRRGLETLPVLLISLGAATATVPPSTRRHGWVEKYAGRGAVFRLLRRRHVPLAEGTSQNHPNSRACARRISDSFDTCGRSGKTC
jgi:hypothetical protein